MKLAVWGLVACSALVHLIIQVPPATAQEVSVAEQAREAFEAHDYTRALGLLQQLRDESPSPRILFNEAICLARLGRHREAAEVLDELLEWPDLTSVFSAEERDAAVEAREDSRARLGELVLDGPPSGVAQVDGTLECALPCSIFLDEGAHTVEFEGQVQTIRLTRGEEERVRVGVQGEEPNEEEVDEEETILASPPSSRFQPSALTWIGAGTALIGAGGVVGFGLRSNDLSDQFVDQGPRAPDSVVDEGRAVTLLTNISLAVAGVGLVLVLIDLLVERHVE